MTRVHHLAAMATIAISYEHRAGYPPEVLIAQWAIESNWGKRPSGKNNLFGMTFNPSRHKSFSWVPTWEELTQDGINRLPLDERQRIRSTVPMSNRPGYFRINVERKFADYETAEDSIADKVGLITTAARYRSAWTAFQQNRDVNALIGGICAAGYATAGNYAALAQQIAAQPNVRQAIAAARAS
jgi:flagellum-specific peptidoglycan hydrolase FlgJ